MANGPRITEALDTRITNDGHTRVTEGYFEGIVHLSSSGSVVANGDINTTGSCNLSASGAIVASGLKLRYAASLVASDSTLTVDAKLFKAGAVSLVSDGSTASFGVGKYYCTATLSASGTITGSGNVIKYGQVLAELINYIRETESGDIRITESGDTRITEDEYINYVTSDLTATGIDIPFQGTPYVKHLSLWKVPAIYCKHSGTWKQPLTIHRRENGIWKRAY